jgi:hypothetical protein
MLMPPLVSSTADMKLSIRLRQTFVVLFVVVFLWGDDESALLPRGPIPAIIGGALTVIGFMIRGRLSDGARPDSSGGDMD